MPSPGLPALPGKTSSTSAENSGALTVVVPFDAKVYINGKETHSTGSRRQYVSYGLEPGMSYKYVVKVQVVRNGELQEDSKTETLAAGDIKGVAFGFNPSTAEVAGPTRHTERLRMAVASAAEGSVFAERKATTHAIRAVQSLENPGPSVPVSSGARAFFCY